MLEIKPISKANAVVTVPSSKSYSNRALLIAALADGKSHINNCLSCDDTRYMIDALKSFGIKIIENNTQITIQGCSGRPQAPQNNIFVGNAGTSMRFLCSFAALSPGEILIDGNLRMQKRPLKYLIHGLSDLGVEIKSVNNNGCPPVKIKGGSFMGGETVMGGEKSSQYFTSILLSAPYAKNDVTIKVKGELTSKPYIDLTLDLMKTFGVQVENRSYSSFFIKAGQSYKARHYEVEGDASSASYFFAAAAITKGCVQITNLKPATLQGDIKFIDVLKRMGCIVKNKDNNIEVQGGSLIGININMNEMPDLVPTLAVMALFAKGETVITGVSNLRIKETDRIKALVAELTQLGGSVKELDDGLVIVPGKLQPAEIETYEDHRMAMSFSIAGLKIPGVKIKNPECVSKSYPDFFEELQSLYNK
jgi:3-phosphoshikimate 1-carboxyvinyltransferase